MMANGLLRPHILFQFIYSKIMFLNSSFKFKENSCIVAEMFLHLYLLAKNAHHELTKHTSYVLFFNFISDVTLI